MGRIFQPDGSNPWMKSHAAVPFAEQRPVENVLRLYFNSRDDSNRARVGRLDLDLRDGRVLEVGDEPVIDVGPPGAFDESGVIGSWIVENDGVKYLYFSGITLGVSVPFYFYVGLATSDDGGETFQKVAAAPILDRSAVDPYLTGQVSVMIDGGVWRMWYVSGDRWERTGSELRHYYHIKYAESSDGLHWRREGLVCVDFQGAEYAIARPCVHKDGDLYKMWYCYRGENYRIGYAESNDGLIWVRRDGESGIDCSKEGWDSSMLAYPFVLDHGRDRYLIYNGNDYGKSGLGWARYDDHGDGP